MVPVYLIHCLRRMLNSAPPQTPNATPFSSTKQELMLGSSCETRAVKRAQRPPAPKLITEYGSYSWTDLGVWRSAFVPHELKLEVQTVKSQPTEFGFQMSKRTDFLRPIKASHFPIVSFCLLSVRSIGCTATWRTRHIATTAWRQWPVLATRSVIACGSCDTERSRLTLSFLLSSVYHS